MIAAGVLLALVGVYLGSWPLRRLAGRTETGARIAAVQELLLALGGLYATTRGRDD